MLLANFNGKEHLRHRAVSLRQHGFLVIYKVVHGLAPGYPSPFTNVADLPSRRSLRSIATNRLVVPVSRLLTVGSTSSSSSSWPWPWFIPYPTGHIGPHFDAIRVCQELPPLLPSRWTQSFVGLCWLCSSSSLLVDLVGPGGPLLYPGTCQYSACCGMRWWSTRKTCQASPAKSSFSQYVVHGLLSISGSDLHRGHREIDLRFR